MNEVTVTVDEEREIPPLEDRPELPPGWQWDPECDLKDLCRPWWRAWGPKVRQQTVTVHAKLYPDDTPEGCAEVAWTLWEKMSGLTRADLRLIEEGRAAVERLERVEGECVEMIGGGEVLCHLCQKIYRGEERVGDEKGPWHAPFCIMYLKEFR